MKLRKHFEFSEILCFRFFKTIHYLLLKICLKIIINNVILSKHQTCTRLTLLSLIIVRYWWFLSCFLILWWRWSNSFCNMRFSFSHFFDDSWSFIYSFIISIAFITKFFKKRVKNCLIFFVKRNSFLNGWFFIVELFYSIIFQYLFVFYL